MTLHKIFALILIVILFLTACNRNAQTDDNTSQLKIYTSFYAIDDFTRKICGDKADIRMLVPVGAEPHDWEPTSREMMNMADADMIVYNGAGMEHWIDSVRAAINNDDIKYVEASAGITGYPDTDDDPHVWLNPVNAGKELENIKNALAEIDPDNIGYYNSNFETVMKEIDLLDAAFKATLGELENRNIVVSHKAYGYLCEAYGLNQIALEGLSAESEPTPQKMAGIIDFIRDNNIKYIFMEELTNSKSIDKIADETGAEILALNPYEGVSDDGADYFSVMYGNLENLKKALE